MICYTIPGQPITKKNSQRMVRNPKTGKMFPLPSKAFVDYEAAASYCLQPKPTEPLCNPLEIEYHFYMPTKRRVDLTNLEEAADDILVKQGVLADDNCRIIVSHDGSRVHYDKQNPRTEIQIREVNTFDHW